MPDISSEHSTYEKRAFYRPELARVLNVRKRTDTETFLELQMADGRPLGHAPGQFVQLSVFGYGEAPISVCSSPTRPESFELCIRPVGNVSRAMHKLNAGDWVGVRGPYGQAFPVAAMKSRHILVIAGGIGVAPLRSLINYIVDRRQDFKRLIIVYGARRPSSILFQDDIHRWSNDSGAEMYLTVDQPDETWKGRTGMLTIPLREINVDSNDLPVAAVAGPPVMYRFVAMELIRKGIDEERIYFSLERRFKCGIGKCGHCQLNNLYVCQDGPVFLYSQLLGCTEAIEVWAPENRQD
ncbi:MAG: FAD/NAD(P)-binding protein [Desulforhabdus sp.]|jgi:NAD(P)H-flavin reductase|nr:FAD/NAD(P)-binding protein [Desulforhabdus sp.]